MVAPSTTVDSLTCRLRASLATSAVTGTRSGPNITRTCGRKVPLNRFGLIPDA